MMWLCWNFSLRPPSLRAWRRQWAQPVTADSFQIEAGEVSRAILCESLDPNHNFEHNLVFAEDLGPLQSIWLPWKMCLVRLRSWRSSKQATWLCNWRRKCEPDIAPRGWIPKASLRCERNCRLQAMLAFVAARIFKSAGLPQHMLLYSDACFKACMSCKEKCNSCTTWCKRLEDASVGVKSCSHKEMVLSVHLQCSTFRILLADRRPMSFCMVWVASKKPCNFVEQRRGKCFLSVCRSRSFQLFPCFKTRPLESQNSLELTSQKPVPPVPVRD